MIGDREYMVGWYDATLDAGMWFGLASLTPREAAMMLCQFNPHNDSYDPLTCNNLETNPDDFKRLLRVFDDEQKVEPKARNLRQWLATAHDRRLKYHSWIDAYALARDEESPVDSCSEDNAPNLDGDGTAAIEEPKTKNWILLVQAEAAKRWKALRAAGANPTKHNIKDDLATWCKKTNVLTRRGINPTSDYLYRHVLRKWTPPKN